MHKIALLPLLLLLSLSQAQAQGGFPWERPLNIATSTDGITFNPPTIYQDSSGVPSVVRWKGDTLVCAFQWFRQPNPSPSWDRVAVKFSYDNGASWTEPSPIVVNGIPGTYQRPFDPTLLALNDDSIRVYFSSSDGMPPMIGLDSTVNTYSAVSTDGVNYAFEPNARVDELSNRVIDPAVVRFNNAFHYAAPIGSPQQGAYHYVSPNGLNFNKVQDIPSNNTHNWTGNYMVEDSSELRFYGAGANGIWYNSTPNGGQWNGYVNTNLLQGGDPSALKLAGNSYIIIYVGPPYATGIDKGLAGEKSLILYPNPANTWLNVKADPSLVDARYTVLDAAGRVLLRGRISAVNSIIEVEGLPSGIYLLNVGDAACKTFSVARD